MTPDWTATQEPFSRAFARAQVTQTVRVLSNGKFTPEAKRREIKDLAWDLAQVMKKELYPAKTPGPFGSGEAQ
jgi:hypothetical protein